MKKGPVCQHHLVKYSEPQKQIKTCVDCVTFHLTAQGTLQSDARHADGRVFDLGLRQGEKAIITKISMLYCTNDTERNVELELYDMFGPEEKMDGSDLLGFFREAEHKHPDQTGRVRFILPKSANGKVPHAERLIYEPNLSNLGFPVIQYAGLEHSILNARSTAVSYESAPHPGFEIFKRTDHLIVFLLENKAYFKRDIGLDDIIALPDGEHYKVSQKAIVRVREFFETSVFPLFRYTTTNHVRVSWVSHEDLPQVPTPSHLQTPAEAKHAARRNEGFSIVVLFLEIEFVVVEQGPLRYQCTQKDLKI